MRPTDEKYQGYASLLIDSAEQDPGVPPGKRGPVSLEQLVRLMKQRSPASPCLSSVYFAGADVDHPFFLRNDRIAIGLAVLPEDAQKAGQAKRHPHQDEVVFVLSGRLVLHIEEAGQARQVLLAEGQHFVIRQNACHRISPVQEEDAVFLFVKTNPAQEPRAVPCQVP